MAVRDVETRKSNQICCIAIVIGLGLIASLIIPFVLKSRSNQQDNFAVTDAPIATPVQQETDGGSDCQCVEKKILISELYHSTTIESPNYPNKYCNFMDCSWTITTRPDYVIKLEWKVFSTEDQMDMVYIHDGNHKESPILQICTGSQCSSQTSSTDKMHVHFNSDHVTVDLGFKAKVSAVSAHPCYCSPMTISLPEVGDSFLIQTPRYPQPYCRNHDCKWTVSTSPGLGLELHWYKVNIKQQGDSVAVFDGDSALKPKLERCDFESECTDVRSKTDTIFVKFESSEIEPNTGGFSAIVFSIENYCMKDLLYVPVGSLSYTDELNEQQVHVGSKATLTCPDDSKIFENTEIDSRHDIVTCLAPLWDKNLPLCTIICPLPISKPNNIEDVEFCFDHDQKYNENDNSIASMGSIQTQRYNIFTNQILSPPQKYTCYFGEWKPEPPDCNPSVIVYIGGLEYEVFTVELYDPILKINSVVRIDQLLPSDEHIINSGSVLLPDGHLLILMGEYFESRLYDSRWLSRYTLSYDLYSKKAETYPFPHEEPIHPQSAVVDGEAYTCSGDVCEVFRNGQWHMIEESMKQKRYDMAIVSLNGYLYAVGGNHFDDYINLWGEVYIKRVERYSPHGGWEYVSDMNTPRSLLGAVVYKGAIYACGGIGYGTVTNPEELDICERYIEPEDRWEYMASMAFKGKAPALAVFNSKIYAFVGNVIQSYDPDQDQWQEEPVKLSVAHRIYGTAITLPLWAWQLI